MKVAIIDNGQSGFSEKLSSAMRALTESTKSAPALPGEMESCSVSVLVSAGTSETERKDRHPLYFLRRAAGLTEEELADRVGLTKRMIQHYERGTFQPAVGVAFKLARVLGVTVDRLFGIPYKHLARVEDPATVCPTVAKS